MANSARGWITEAEYLQLPETNERMELLDGEVYLSPSPTFDHQDILIRLTLALGNYVAQSNELTDLKLTLIAAPLDIRFAANRILQPDLAVFRTRLPRGIEMPITVLPELVIEILSQDERRDRVVKRAVYQESGVSEYWMVDTEASAIERLLFGKDGAWQQSVHDSSLRTPVLPGFELDVAVLFRN